MQYHCFPLILFASIVSIDDLLVVWPDRFYTSSLFTGALCTVNDAESGGRNLGPVCLSGIMANAGDIIRRLIFFGMRNYGNWLGRT